MGTFYLIGLIVTAVISLTFSVLGFMGKDMILDSTYIKAPKEEQSKMDKKAYSLQGTIIFLFLFALTLCNILRIVLRIAALAYVALAITVIGIAYTIISHYHLKKKQ